MGVLDFLFEGKPPASVTTYGSTMQNVPSWLSDYTQGLLARANTVAAEPYQPYGAPRIAGFSPLQTAAQDMAKDNVGKWSPFTDAAKSGYEGVMQGPGALSQAKPFLDAGTMSYTDQVQKYMDPYVDNVIDRSTMLAQRKLEEQLLPAIKGNFIKSGAYGSAGQQRAVGQALRDVTGEVQSQARAALSDAYSSGANLQGAEAMRMLQAGQTAGSLYGQDMSQRLNASSGLGGLGQMIQSLRGQDAAGLAAAGQDQQNQQQRNLDLAYSDFLQQRDLPMNRVSWMNSIINGLPNMGGTTQTSNTGPANSYQPSPISQLASLYGLYRGVKEEFSDDDGNARGGLARYYAAGGPAKRLGYRRVPGFVRMKGVPFTDWHIGPVKRAPIENRRPGDGRGRRVIRDFHDSNKRYARGGLATMRRIANGR